MKIKTSIIKTDGPKEIERKFKVSKLPENLEAFPKNEIRQGYISIEDNGIEIRIRQKNERYFKTIKSGTGVVRNEIETSISKNKFEKLWNETYGKNLEKTRYEIKLDDGNLAELDVYKGPLKGLIVVEVEFTNENKANDFLPPNWFGEDVSENQNYKNSSLAVKGNPK